MCSEIQINHRPTCMFDHLNENIHTVAYFKLVTVEFDICVIGKRIF